MCGNWSPSSIWQTQREEIRRKYNSYIKENKRQEQGQRTTGIPERVQGRNGSTSTEI
jgi:hypothetical protein